MRPHTDILLSMEELLLVGATEELQTLVVELEQAGLHVSTCRLDEAAGCISADEPADALLVNLMDGADETVDQLARVDSIPARPATVAILRSDQLTALAIDLPADDFVSFPTPTDELVVRIRRAARRRVGAEGPDVLRFGDLAIDQAGYRVFVGGRPVELTYKEYELLRCLALNQDKVCTREMLLSQVWGYDFYGGARTVDVHIRRLRSKIEHSAHSLVETVRNVGYRFHVG
jgi:DNA-binding response OmpR family regulator